MVDKLNKRTPPFDMTERRQGGREAGRERGREGGREGGEREADRQGRREEGKEGSDGGRKGGMRVGEKGGLEGGRGIGKETHLVNISRLFLLFPFLIRTTPRSSAQMGWEWDPSSSPVLWRLMRCSMAESWE